MKALYRSLPVAGATLLSLAAQQPPYSLKLTEPDQEPDDFTFRFKSIHQITPQLRGVRGSGNTLYWVSADGKWLTAYQRGQQLWRVDVAKAFLTLLPTARIDHLIFSSGFVFVFTSQRGHAEVNRATGSISAVEVN